MSYNIGIHVKVEGCDKLAKIAEPEMSRPTYNLGKMFRACMDWDFYTVEKDENGEYRVSYYPCSFVLEQVEHGLSELESNGIAYTQYTPSNSWANITTVWQVLQSLRECIHEQAVEIPIECLYMSWV